ncbi:hypothetical protein M3Y99_01554600 [Aphelenchoides fujianensis]|nr:hypothetical protein M3Y99_01554600 [Aphelenchoides fujianensis]
MPDNTEIVSEWLATKEQFKTSANRGCTPSAVTHLSQMSHVTRRSNVSVNGAHSTLSFHPPVEQQAGADGGADLVIDVLKGEVKTKFADMPVRRRIFEVLPTVLTTELTTNAQRLAIGTLFWEGIVAFEMADLNAPPIRLLVCELVQVFVHLCHWPHPEVSSGCRNVFKRFLEARRVVELACVMISTPLPNNDPLYRPLFIRLLTMCSEPFLEVRLKTPLYHAHPALLAGMLQELSVLHNQEQANLLPNYGMLAKYLRLEAWAFETVTEEKVMGDFVARALPPLLHVFVKACTIFRVVKEDQLPFWKSQQVYLEAIARMIPRLTWRLMKTEQLRLLILQPKTNAIQMLLTAQFLDPSSETGAVANEFVIRTFAELRGVIPKLPWETLLLMLNYILNALPFLIQPKDTSSMAAKKRAVLVTGAAARFFAYPDPNNCLFPKILKLTEAWACNAMEQPKTEHFQTLCSFFDTIIGVVSRDNPQLNQAIQILNASQEAWFIFFIGIVGSKQLPAFPLQTYRPKMLNVLFLCTENNTLPQFDGNPRQNIAFFVLQFIAAHFFLQENNQLPDTARSLAASLDMAVTIVQRFLRDENYQRAIQQQLVDTVTNWDPFTILGFVNDDDLFRTILRFIYHCLEACPQLSVHWSQRNNNQDVWMRTLQSGDQEFRQLAARIDQLLGQGQVAGILPFAMPDDYAAQPWG